LPLLSIRSIFELCTNNSPSRPDVETSLNADKKALAANVKNFPDQVYAVTVGSETLYRGNFTGKELGEKISEVKKVLPSSVKVGTADSWNKYADGTADDVIRNPDVTIL
jgi:glucan 1,3-beta-glucosidase